MFYRVCGMKKYMTVLFCAVFLVLAGSACRQHDYHTLVVKVPEMRNQACVRRIAVALWSSPALKKKGYHPKRKNEVVPVVYLLSESVSFDIAKREVTVTYDSLLTADKNIEFLIAKAGFKANDIPADPKAAAALPPECRR